MSHLSISRAWNEAVAFIKREAGLLFPIAFALIAVPTAFFQAVAPRAEAGQTVEPGSWMLLMIPLIILSMIGTLTLTVLALKPETVVRDAIAAAARRFLPVFISVLLLSIVAVAVAVPIVLILALLMETQAGMAALLVAVFVCVLISLWVRLMLMNPVGAVESGGPISIIRRSWSLTAGHFWKLLGFVVLMVVLFLVLSIAAKAIGGILIMLVAGQPDPGSLSAVLVLLLSALLNTVLGVYFTAIIAFIYAQLEGSSTSGT